MTDLPAYLTGRMDTTGDCWTWEGAHGSNGYAQVKVDGRVHDVHRLVCALVHGEPDSGMQVDHLCRNRKCVNPTHLEWVSQRENIKRGTALSAATLRALDADGTCQRGHDMSLPGAWQHLGGHRRQCRECQRLRDQAYRDRRRQGASHGI